MRKTFELPQFKSTSLQYRIYIRDQSQFISNQHIVEPIPVLLKHLNVYKH